MEPSHTRLKRYPAILHWRVFGIAIDPNLNCEPGLKKGGYGGGYAGGYPGGAPPGGYGAGGSSYAPPPGYAARTGYSGGYGGGNYGRGPSAPPARASFDSI